VDDDQNLLEVEELPSHFYNTMEEDEDKEEQQGRGAISSSSSSSSRRRDDEWWQRKALSGFRKETKLSYYHIYQFLHQVRNSQ